MQDARPIQEQREGLPIFAFREQILQGVKDHQIIILSAETGSGKTTQVTQYLAESGWTSKVRCVTCTMPCQAVQISRYKHCLRMPHSKRTTTLHSRLRVRCFFDYSTKHQMTVHCKESKQSSLHEHVIAFARQCGNYCHKLYCNVLTWSDCAGQDCVHAAAACCGDVCSKACVRGSGMPFGRRCGVLDPL